MAHDRILTTRNAAKPPFFVGVDLGGTTAKIAVVDDAGTLLFWGDMPTEVHRGPEDAARRIGEAVARAIGQAGLTIGEVARIGLGSPGTLDFRAGTMITPTNFPGWGGFPIRDAVSEQCGSPVSLANDASAAAYGEFWIGAGKSYQSMILLTLGTGVGCGIIIGDLILEGENGHGTECGHIIIDPSPSARVCSCGQTGHLEAYASAKGVVGRMTDAMRSMRPTSLTRHIAVGRELTPLLIAEEAESGDRLAHDIIMETADYLALGIVTLLHTIDPTGVLIGGAMTFGMKGSDLGRCFLDRVRTEVRRRTFPVLAERTLIDYASLGTDAGVIGAAGIARVDHFKHMRRGAKADRSLTPTASTRSVG